MSSASSSWSTINAGIGAEIARDPSREQILCTKAQSLYAFPTVPPSTVRRDSSPQSGAAQHGVLEPHLNAPSGRIFLLEELGPGGSSVVYLGRLESTQDLAAVKVFTGGAAAERLRRSQQAREALLQLDVSGPGLRRVLEAGTGTIRKNGATETCPYLLMQYIPGCSLTGWVQKAWAREELLSVENCVAIATVIADILIPVHSRGRAHGDVKPSNVLIHDGPAVDLAGRSILELRQVITLVDFGQAGLEGEAKTARTPPFSAPENTISPEDDVFALGQVLRYLLWGGMPEWAAAGVPEPARARWEHYSKVSARDLAAIINCCLAESPSERYRSAKELVDDLTRWLGRHTLAFPKVEYSLTARYRLLGLRCALFDNHADHSELWANAFLVIAPAGMAFSALAAIVEIAGADHAIAHDGIGAAYSGFVLALCIAVIRWTRHGRLTDFVASIGLFYIAAMWVLRYVLVPDGALAESLQLLLTAAVFYFSSYFEPRWRLLRPFAVAVLLLAAMSPQFVGRPLFVPFRAILQGWTLAIGQLLICYNLFAHSAPRPATPA